MNFAEKLQKVLYAISSNRVNVMENDNLQILLGKIGQLQSFNGDVKEFVRLCEEINLIANKNADGRARNDQEVLNLALENLTVIKNLIESLPLENRPKYVSPDLGETKQT